MLAELAQTDQNTKNARLNMWLTATVAIVTTIVGAIVTVQVTKMSQTVEKIHVATNSGRTELLRLVVAQSKKIAEESGKPDDILAYDRAVKDLASAEAAQKALEEKQ